LRYRCLFLKAASRSAGGLGEIYVVPKEELVTTRFFIVNPESGGAAARATAQAIVSEAVAEGKFRFLA